MRTCVCACVRTCIHACVRACVCAYIDMRKVAHCLEGEVLHDRAQRPFVETVMEPCRALVLDRRDNDAEKLQRLL